MDIKRPQPSQPIPSHAKRVFRGIVFDVYHWEQDLYDGARTIFEGLKRRDTVTVFPVLADGRILLTEQEQPGKAPFIGATGGGVDDGEDVLDAAKRELLEESGYEAKEYVLWHSQNSIPKTDWPVYVFIAKGLTKVAEMNLDGGEKIKLLPVTLDELIDIATNKNVRFVEKEVLPQLLEAKYNPQIKAELAALFKPN